MNSKEIEKFAVDTDKRIAAQQKLIDRQHETIATIAAMQGDLAAGHARQNERIAALEAELARVQNIAFSPKAAAPVSHDAPPRTNGPGAVRDEQRPIVSHVATVPGVMPTTSQKKKLLAIVAAKHISLAGVTLESFSSCFDFIAMCSRKGRLDTQTAPADWLDQCSRHTHDWSITLNGFIAAAIAHSVLHSDFSRAPFDLSFGLTRHGTNNMGDAWRKLLDGEKVIDPIPNAPLDKSLGIQKRVAVY